MTLDHSALWSMYASLEELRGKIGHVLKCAIQMSKVAWSNVIAKRCNTAQQPVPTLSHLTSAQTRFGYYLVSMCSVIYVPLPANPTLQPTSHYLSCISWKLRVVTYGAVVGFR